MAQINVACDKLATETAQHIIAHDHPPDHSMIQPPYTGSKVLLNFGRKWIMASMEKHIYSAAHLNWIWCFCAKEYRWTDQVLTLSLGIPSVLHAQGQNQLPSCSLVKYCMDDSLCMATLLAHSSALVVSMRMRSSTTSSYAPSL